MSVSKRSLLFFEDSLDLGHLKQSLENLEIDSKFCDNIETFYEQVNNAKYDMLIVSGVGGNNNYPVIDSLYASTNSDTPILYIADNNEFPAVDEILKFRINIITFPFATDEFLFRTMQLLRSAEIDLSVHKNLSNYKTILDTLPVGVVQTDSHGKFIKANLKFLHTINMSENDLFKENFFQLCHPDDYFLERKQLDRLLKKELSCVDYEIRLINNEGQTTVCVVESIIQWSGNDIFEAFLFVIRKVS